MKKDTTIENIKTILLWFVVFYVLNKELWDWASFGVSKVIYYMVIAGGSFLGAIQLLLKKSTRPIVVSFFVYIIVVVVNAVLLSNRDQFRVGVIQYVTYPLAFFAVFYFMKGKKNFFSLFRTLVIWGVLTSILAVVEYMTMKSVLPGFKGMLYPFQNGALVYRATVFIGSPLVLGVVLGAVAIVACFLLYQEKKLWYLAAVVIILVGILCTGSRGPLLCSLGGSVVMFGLLIFRNGISKKALITLIVVGGICAFGVVILLIFPGISTGFEPIDFFIYRFTSALDFKHEWGNVERVKRWTYYLGEFAEKPLFGHGLASTSALVASNEMVTSHGVTTESGVLARFVESGIFGAVAYYVFLSICGYRGLKGLLKRKVVSEEIECRFFVAGVVVLLLTEDIILQISLDIFCNFIMWFMLAYAINQVLNHDEPYDKTWVTEKLVKLGLL